MLGLNYIDFFLSQIDLLPDIATEKMKEDILEGSGDTLNPIQGHILTKNYIFDLGK